MARTQIRVHRWGLRTGLCAVPQPELTRVQIRLWCRLSSAILCKVEFFRSFLDQTHTYISYGQNCVILCKNCRSEAQLGLIFIIHQIFSNLVARNGAEIDISFLCPLFDRNINTEQNSLCSPTNRVRIKACKRFLRLKVSSKKTRLVECLESNV